MTYILLKEPNEMEGKANETGAGSKGSSYV